MERESDPEIDLDPSLGAFCSVCKGLGVKALVLESENALKRLEKDGVNRKRIHGSGDFQVAIQAGVVYEHHKNILELREASSTCDFCAEIWQCFRDNAGLPDELLEPELGRGLCTKPISILFSGDRWQHDRLPKLVALQFDQDESTRIIACFDVCTEAGGVKPRDFPGRCGRRLYSYSGSKECLSLAKSWLQHCSTKHRSCIEFLKTAKLPTRVIDVREKPKLVDGEGRIAPYVALSYSWGGESALMLTNKTESEFRDSLPPAALPPTISDTIAISKELGIPYVWIDALCIFQDSELDFLSESSKMRQVYRGATLTIHGSSAGKINDNLFVHRNYRYVKMPWGNKGLQEYIYLREDSQATQIRLESCPVNWRGWCLQESLLATRSLWIGERQMLFECTETQAEETCSVKYKAPEAYRSKRSMRQLAQHEKSWVKSCSFRTWGVLDLITVWYPSLAIWELRKSWNLTRAIRINVVGLYSVYKLAKGNGMSVYDYWREIVSQYTLRQLTRPNDVFPALSGLADTFHRATGEDYMAGHWRGDLAFSLYWSCRLLDRKLTMAHEQVASAIKKHHSTGYLAPSWSWASMISGHVLFGPRIVGNSANSFPSHFYALESPRIIDVFTVPESDTHALSRVSSGRITLRVPFVLVPDPRELDVADKDLPEMKKYIYRFLAEESDVSSKKYEFTIKHRPHEGQKFALLRVGVYESMRRSYFYKFVKEENLLSRGSTKETSIGAMLVETCGPEITSELHDGKQKSANDGVRWRRLALFDISFNEQHYAMSWATEELKAELTGPKWHEKTICLV